MAPPTAQKKLAAQRERQRKRVLDALDRAIWKMSEATRWRIICENSPPGSQINRRAHDEWQKASQFAFDGFNLVRLALGYDPNADEPPPKRHWDAGA